LRVKPESYLRANAHEEGFEHVLDAQVIGEQRQIDAGVAQ
jgi:hypothetical protein